MQALIAGCIVSEAMPGISSHTESLTSHVRFE